MCDRCGEFSFFGLAEPQEAMLESYAAALREGWSPNNTRDVSGEQLRDIETDPAGFLAKLIDPAVTETFPDGTIMQRLPFQLRWMWDGDFCGVISLRHQPGTSTLPSHAAGHIGYAVVPWKRRHGYASRGLRQMLDEAREVGLARIELAMAPDNTGSRQVVERCGGQRDGTWSHPSFLAGTWSHDSFAATGVLDRYVIGLQTEQSPRGR